MRPATCSAWGWQALSPALSLARAANARLRVIAAVPPAVSAGPVGGAAYGVAMAERRRACERALGDAIDRLPADVGVEWSVEEGFPAQILVDASDEVDLLVVASRGYTPLHAMLVGAVSPGAARVALSGPRQPARIGRERRR